MKDTKNNKGFTLIELIAVIVIMGIVLALVAPSLINSSGAAKQKTYETKKALIESAAVFYGQDNYKKIVDTGVSTGDGSVYTLKIHVKDLIPKYVSKDNESATEGKSVEDPREKSAFLDDKCITINVNTVTRKVWAELSESNVC